MASPPRTGRPRPLREPGEARSLSPSSQFGAITIEQLLGRLELFVGRLVAQVGANREVHQLRQRAPDPCGVAGGEHLADSRLDAAEDEEASRLGRLLAGVDFCANAVQSA